MAGEEASTSGRFLSSAVSERLLWAALAATAVPLIGAVWWLCETGLNSLAPPQVLHSLCCYTSSCTASLRPKAQRNFSTLACRQAWCAAGSTSIGRAPSRHTSPACLRDTQSGADVSPLPAADCAFTTTRCALGNRAPLWSCRQLAVTCSALSQDASPFACTWMAALT